MFVFFFLLKKILASIQFVTIIINYMHACIMNELRYLVYSDKYILHDWKLFGLLVNKFKPVYIYIYIWTYMFTLFIIIKY